MTARYVVRGALLDEGTPFGQTMFRFTVDEVPGFVVEKDIWRHQDTVREALADVRPDAATAELVFEIDYRGYGGEQIGDGSMADVDDDTGDLPDDDMLAAAKTIGDDEYTNLDDEGRLIERRHRALDEDGNVVFRRQRGPGAMPETGREQQPIAETTQPRRYVVRGELIREGITFRFTVDGMPGFRLDTDINGHEREVRRALAERLPDARAALIEFDVDYTGYIGEQPDLSMLEDLEDDDEFWEVDRRGQLVERRYRELDEHGQFVLRVEYGPGEPFIGPRQRILVAEQPWYIESQRRMQESIDAWHRRHGLQPHSRRARQERFDATIGEWMLVERGFVPVRDVRFTESADGEYVLSYFDINARKGVALVMVAVRAERADLLAVKDRRGRMVVVLPAYNWLRR